MNRGAEDLYLQEKHKVKVTIGIPAYNEEKTIGYLLRDVLKQSRNQRISVDQIIVNASGSVDSTATKVATTKLLDNSIILIMEPKRAGKASALNDILKYSRSDIVVFIDGDLVLGENCIYNIVKPLLRREVGVISGRVKSLNPHRGPTSLSFLARELHHEICLLLSENNESSKVDGSFYAFRKQIIKQFPPSVISDDEYVSLKAQSMGLKVLYIPSAIVYASDPSSIKSFIDWQARMILGQFYIRKSFGYQVPTMKISVMLLGLMRLTRIHRVKMFAISGFAFFGILSYIKALIMRARRESAHIY